MLMLHGRRTIRRQGQWEWGEAKVTREKRKERGEGTKGKPSSWPAKRKMEKEGGDLTRRKAFVEGRKEQVCRRLTCRD